jgi:DNA-binding NarL/FixJ family response regulator
MLLDSQRQNGRSSARIFVVENHARLREQLLAHIQRDPGLEICGSASDIESADFHSRESEPDLLLLGLSLRSRKNLGWLTELVQARPEIPVLVLTTDDSESSIERTLAAGARGCLTKQEAVGGLRAAIRTLLAGQVYRGKPAPRSNGAGRREATTGISSHSNEP